jgi:hypothetical protein
LHLIQENTSALTQCCFTAVIVGVTEVALETARRQVAPRHNDLRAYERVEAGGRRVSTHQACRLKAGNAAALF